MKTYHEILNTVPKGLQLQNVFSEWTWQKAMDSLGGGAIRHD